jgi:hypothetical protein
MVLPIVALVLLATGALGFVGYVLWPRWPAGSTMPDAPTLPITVGNVLFNLPPAAIRVPLQRKPGAHERIDLVFIWPSLTPPDANAKTPPPAPAAADAPPAPPKIMERVFVSIANANATLGPAERVKTIYPRYVSGAPVRGPGGLAVLAFNDNSPYRGEDLVYDGSAPANFLVRCNRTNGPTPGMCLFERRIEGADVTVRFPRDWLNDWRPVADGIARLIAKLRPASG